MEMRKDKTIVLLQMANERLMLELEAEHKEYIANIEKDPKVIKWYSQHQQIINLNLFELQDKEESIERHIQNRLNGISSRDKQLYKTIFETLWEPVLFNVKRRISRLKGVLFKIKALENKGKHIPYPQISAEEIRESVRIEDVCASNNIEIKQNRAVCPLHPDDDPSFRIYPDTNSFFCFGCQKGGDVITLMMELHNCDFREALNLLSQFQ